MRAVIRRPKVTGDELIAMIGPPDFLTGGTVTGDLAANLDSGEEQHRATTTGTALPAGLS